MYKVVLSILRQDRRLLPSIPKDIQVHRCNRCLLHSPGLSIYQPFQEGRNVTYAPIRLCGEGIPQDLQDKADACKTSVGNLRPPLIFIGQILSIAKVVAVRRTLRSKVGEEVLGI